MLNQASVEALYSANYIENYLDYVENVPMEISRCVSRVRELDLTHVGLMKEIEQHTETLLHELDNSLQKKQLLLTKTQQALIWAQEVGDEKLRVMQQVQDIIENKTRQLDLDYRSLADVGKESEGSEGPKDSVVRDIIVALPLSNGFSAGERQSKRVRRTRTDLALRDQSPSNDSAPTPEPHKQLLHSVQLSTPTSSALVTSQKKVGIAIGKKKKRKNRQSTQQSSQKDAQLPKDRESSPQREEDSMADPDEPTYCLCNQISYGEMIMCDNDFCPYEWFHFACVSLGVKPKGKWFCPTCRGDRSSIMKPKSQLLKELERLKQEREAKDEKSS